MAATNRTTAMTAPMAKPFTPSSFRDGGERPSAAAGHLWAEWPLLVLHRTARVDLAALHQVLVPETVVLLGPVAVDQSGPDGGEGALHADGPDIDVAEDEADHQDTGDHVDALSQFHAVIAGPEEGKHHGQTRHHQDRATNDHAPEDQLLTGVEFSSRWVE